MSVKCQTGRQFVDTFVAVFGLCMFGALVAFILNPHGAFPGGSDEKKEEE